MAARRAFADSRGAILVGARGRPRARSAVDGWLAVVPRAECAPVMSVVSKDTILRVIETSSASPSVRVRGLRVFPAPLLPSSALPYGPPHSVYYDSTKHAESVIISLAVKQILRTPRDPPPRARQRPSPVPRARQVPHRHPHTVHRHPRAANAHTTRTRKGLGRTKYISLLRMYMHARPRPVSPHAHARARLARLLMTARSLSVVAVGHLAGEAGRAGNACV